MFTGNLPRAANEDYVLDEAVVRAEILEAYLGGRCQTCECGEEASFTYLNRDALGGIGNAGAMYGSARELPIR